MLAIFHCVLGRVVGRDGNTVKTLRGIGFTEKIEEVATQSIRGGGARIKTISIDDFNRLIVYAVGDGKKAALALQLSLSKLALNDFFRDAFGDVPLTIGFVYYFYSAIGLYFCGELSRRWMVLVSTRQGQ